MSVCDILQDFKTLETLFTCSICIGSLNNAVETRCGHRFCSDCIDGLLRQGKNTKCPLCKSTLSKRNTKTTSHFSAKSYDIWSLLKTSEFTRSSQGSPLKKASTNLKHKAGIPVKDISSNTGRQEQVTSWLQDDQNNNQNVGSGNDTSQKTDYICQDTDDVLLVGASATQDGLHQDGLMQSHLIQKKPIKKKSSFNTTSKEYDDVFEETANLEKKRRRERSDELFGSDDEKENHTVDQPKEKEEVHTVDKPSKIASKPAKGKSKKRKLGNNTAKETRKRKSSLTERSGMNCEDSKRDSDNVDRCQDEHKISDAKKLDAEKSSSADKEEADLEKQQNTVVIRSKKRLKLNLDKTTENVEIDNEENDPDLIDEDSLPAFNLKVKGKSRKMKVAEELEDPDASAQVSSKQRSDKNAAASMDTDEGELDKQADVTIMEVETEPMTIDDQHNNRDSTPPIDDSLCSDKDEIWSTPPAPNKSQLSSTTESQTQDTLPTIISAKPARAAVKKTPNNEDIFKEMAQDIQLLLKKSKTIEESNSFIKSIKIEIEGLLTKLDLQVFKGLEAPLSQADNETNDDMNSIVQHREELEVSKNLIDNIKAVTTESAALVDSEAVEEIPDESKSSEKVEPVHDDSMQGTPAEDLQLPTNNVVSQHQDPFDDDSLIPETPEKPSRKNKKRRKPVISDDEDSDEDGSAVAAQKENNSVDTTPIQRSRKKKLANKLDDESDNDVDKEKKMEGNHDVPMEIPPMPEPAHDQLSTTVDKPDMTSHNSLNVSVIEDSMPTSNNIIKGSIKIVEVPANLSKTILTKMPSPPSPAVQPSRKIGIMTSQLSGKPLKIVHSFINKFHATYYNSFKHSETTHLIVKTQQKRCDRTFKYLQALASKIWVVDIKWMADCITQKKLLPEEDYEVAGDNQESDLILSYAPKRSRESDVDFKLLSKHVFHCHPPFSFFSTEQLEELLVLCGAKVVSSFQEFHKFSSDDYQKYVIVDDDVDSQESSLNYSEIGAEYGAETIPNTWILESVATFTLQPTDTYPLKEDDEDDDDIIVVKS